MWEHVERIDSEQALEYSMQNKEGLNETVFLMPVRPSLCRVFTFKVALFISKKA